MIAFNYQYCATDYRCAPRTVSSLDLSIADSGGDISITTLPTALCSSTKPSQDASRHWGERCQALKANPIGTVWVTIFNGNSSPNLTAGAARTVRDDLAERLAEARGGIERRALERLAAEAYSTGRLTKPELCRLLGFEVLDEFDGFLKVHDIYEPYSLADLERERRDLQSLGL
jgi:hypothetical protein